MWTKKFWQDTLERVIRGAAVTLGGVLFVNGSLNTHLDWVAMGTAALAGAIGALVLSLAGGMGVGGTKGDPSLIK